MRINESVQIGEVTAKDVLDNLNMEVTIAVDREELTKIAQVPEVADAMGKVEAPQTRVYGGTERTAGDWRAKVPEIRKAQWIQKPIIDYIAEAHKESALEAVENVFAPMTPEWRGALFGPNRENMQYSKDPKALQLSSLTASDIRTAKKLGKSLWPDDTNKWKYIYVQVSVALGGAESGGFIGQIAKEAQNAADAGAIVKTGEGQMQWASSLSGFETSLRNLDPFAGAKMSDTMIAGRLIADEPGYDLYVREGIIDKIQDVLSLALGTEVSGLDVNDKGVFTFSVSDIPAEEPTEQDEIAQKIEPEELVPDDPSEQDMSLDQSQWPPKPEAEMESVEPKTVKCSNCNGTGEVSGRGGDGERAWLTCRDCGGTGKRKDY